MAKNRALTEDGLRLLVACMTEVYMSTGEWDYAKCAELLKEHGLEMTPRRVAREWLSPGRQAIESEVEQYRQAHLKLMEDRFKWEILKAGIDVASRREGEYWSAEVKNLATAKAKLDSVAPRQAAPQIPPITLNKVQKIEIFPPADARQAAPTPVLEATKDDGSRCEPEEPVEKR